MASANSAQKKPNQAKPRKLTYKQRAFIDEFIATKNGTQTALSVYDTKSENTAAVIAFDNLRNPKIANEIDARFKAVQELYQEHSKQAVITTVELMTQADSDSVRLSAAKDIQDRAGHAPVQKSASISTKTLRIDL